MDELLKHLGPQVLGVLVRRGADFATAEDAVQEAMLEAVRHRPGEAPDDPKAWLVTVANRKYVDAVRSDAARRRREMRDHHEPAPGPAQPADDTLLLLFLCCHPALTPASAVALTLRAVGGLATRQIAQAYLVPESTMAQRISRAKRTIAGERLQHPGDLRSVLKVLYLVFNEGYTGEVDLAEEAIRLTRQLAAATDEPEVTGLLALMLLHHARRASRWTAEGGLVPLAEQDRSRWDTAAIAEGVAILQAALAQNRLGEYQAQAAIAALHADAASASETDWSQILEWYDELARLTAGRVAGPVRRRSRRSPAQRRRGVPARAGRRSAAGPGALRRGGTSVDLCRGTGPPHPAGRAAARRRVTAPNEARRSTRDRSEPAELSEAQHHIWC